MLRCCLTLFAGFVLVAVISPRSLDAQPVTVRSASTQEYQLEPGASGSGHIEVFNASQQVQRVRIYQTDYQFRSDGTLAFPPSGTLDHSAGQWIGLNTTALTVPPQRSLSMEYSVRVPADSVQRGTTYWTIIMVETEPSQASQPPNTRPGTRVSVQIREVYRSATLVAITVAGTKAPREVKLDNWRVVSDSVNGTRRLLVDLENSGLVASRPQVSCEMFDASGISRGVFKGEESERLLLPGSSYTREIDLSSLPAGHYTAIIIADTGSEDLFGAQAEIDLGPKS